MHIRVAKATRRLALAGLTSTCVLVGLGAGATASQAAILQSNTSVSPSADAVSPTQSVTLTAHVGLAALGGSGLIIVPSGSVTFTDQTTGATLGTSTLGTLCLTSGCSATLTVSGSALATDDNVIVASYSGESLAGQQIVGSSSGKTYVDVGTETDCDAGSGGTCVGYAVDAAGDADGEVDAPTSPTGPEQIAVAFGNEPIGCPTDAPILSFAVTGAGSGTKTITYNAQGALADSIHSAHGGSTYMCYDSFNSFTTSSGAAATKQADGSYAGVLPLCVYTGGTGDGGGTLSNPPCVDLDNSFYLGGGEYPSQLYTTVYAPNGDPHMGP